MPIGLEELTAHAPPYLINRIAEDEAAVEDGDLGVLEGNELAVEVDDQGEWD